MNENKIKESFWTRYGQFIATLSVLVTMMGIIVTGFIFTNTSLGHRIDRVEDRIFALEGRVNGIEREVYSINRMMTHTQSDKGEK